MRLWKRLFGPRRSLFLGNITVSSAFSLKKGVTQLYRSPVDPGLLEQTLRDVMALPSVFDRESNDKNDLAIDITVSDYDMGEATLFSLFGFTIPLAWRPEIAMTARVYEIDSNVTIYAHTVKQKLEWKIWLRKVRNLKAAMGVEAHMKPDDVRYLVRRTCVTLLKRVQKQI